MDRQGYRFDHGHHERTHGNSSRAYEIWSIARKQRVARKRSRHWVARTRGFTQRTRRHLPFPAEGEGSGPRHAILIRRTHELSGPLINLEEQHPVGYVIRLSGWDPSSTDPRCRSSVLYANDGEAGLYYRLIFHAVGSDDLRLVYVRTVTAVDRAIPGISSRVAKNLRAEEAGEPRFSRHTLLLASP